VLLSGFSIGIISKNHLEQCMLNLELLMADPKKSEEGVWAEYATGKFLIARYNSERATQLRSELASKHYEQITSPDKSVAEATANKIEVEVTAKELLLDWENIYFGGEKIDYTPEQGIKFLGNPALKDLLTFVTNFSLNRMNYRDKIEFEVTESVKDLSDS